MLYYFAIRDDNPDDLKTLRIEQLISEPSKAYSQIVVERKGLAGMLLVCHEESIANDST